MSNDICHDTSGALKTPEIRFQADFEHYLRGFPRIIRHMSAKAKLSQTAQ